MARQRRQFMRQGVADLPTRVQVDAYVGAPGEPIFDGETLRIHDGVTPGGIRLVAVSQADGVVRFSDLLAALIDVRTAFNGKVERGRVAVNDQNYAAQTTDAYVGYTGLTAARTLLLPPAASYPTGQPLALADETGLCSNTLTLTAQASGSDTVAGQSSVYMASPYQRLTFYSNGSNLWTVA